VAVVVGAVAAVVVLVAVVAVVVAAMVAASDKLAYQHKVRGLNITPLLSP